MQLDLTGKHALVCGASEGIGRAAALELAALGASLTLLSRRAEALREVLQSLPQKPGQAHAFIAVDMRESEALRAQVGAHLAQRPCHILVNNSGGPPAGTALAASSEDYLAAYRQHLIANQILVQQAVPGMQAAGFGRIINVISTSVYEPIPGLGVSNATRAAVAGWAKTLSRELGPFAITVNNVLPGFTETGRIRQILAAQMAQSGQSEAQVREAMHRHVPLQRFAQPEEVAAVIAFLATPAADYVNGQSIAVDGGRMQSI